MGSFHDSFVAHRSHEPEIPLTRPPGTLSPTGGEGRGEGASRFKESFLFLHDLLTGLEPFSKRSLIFNVLRSLLVAGFAGIVSAGQMLSASETKVDSAAVHEALFVENKYPSAASCRTCHPDHYREWSVSPHAGAMMSPVFNAMQATVGKLTSGSIGDFCVRCHSQVSANIGEPVWSKVEDRHPVSREGVTCVVCHRVNQAYGKVNGRIALVEGDLMEPVFGPTGDAEFKRVLSEPGKYKVVIDRDKVGRRMHGGIKRFFQLTESSFCGTCHDVTTPDGFRLDDLFSEFKNTPAAKAGVTCQDCHMGKQPGVNAGYDTAPAAAVGGVATRPRKRTRHMFAGPDHPILHPGIFPHNPEAAKFATISEWLQFDHKAGWGTDDFEDEVPENYRFPARWESFDDRADARDILIGQQKLLAEMQKQRLALLRAGYLPGDLTVKRATKSGLRFEVEARNGTSGHNVPSGFDGDRLVWLFVEVRDSAGALVFQSGDLDPNGDVRDLHSAYVHNGELPLDKHLFSLQSRFVTRNLRGGEREQVLGINYSSDPIPFVRPPTASVVLQGHPGVVRKHKRGIAPLGTRTARYEVKASALTGRGPYTVRIQLKAGMVPVNLVSAISLTGFDYNLSPRAVADAIREGHVVLWDKTVAIELDGSTPTFRLADGHNSSPAEAKAK